MASGDCPNPVQGGARWSGGQHQVIAGRLPLLRRPESGRICPRRAEKERCHQSVSEAHAQRSGNPDLCRREAEEERGDGNAERRRRGREEDDGIRRFIEPSFFHFCTGRANIILRLSCE